jgi:DNA-binding IscR family transcriptional regulator
LARSPELLSVGDVLRVVQGTLAEPEHGGQGNGSHASQAIFTPIWDAASRSASSVYDAASFRVLADRYRTALGTHSPDYSI